MSGERFDVHRMRLLGDDGRTYAREVLRHPGAVVLLPVMDDDHIVMIHNRRPTVDETLLELPAGTREPDEAPEVTASRELIEEAGYEATTLRLLHKFYSAPGISDEVMWLYEASGLREVGACPEAVEAIEPVVMSRGEVEQMVRQGQVRDGKTLVGLYAWLLRFPDPPSA